MESFFPIVDIMFPLQRYVLPKFKVGPKKAVPGEYGQIFQI